MCEINRRKGEEGAFRPMIDAGITAHGMRLLRKERFEMFTCLMPPPPATENTIF